MQLLTSLTSPHHPVAKAQASRWLGGEEGAQGVGGCQDDPIPFLC